jgi:surface polysaccharide O-acyltransferase-like enzyme
VTRLYYVYGLLLTESLPDLVDLGGKSWRSLVFCAWEALVLAGLGVGLLVLFRDRLNKAPGKLLGVIIGAAFGAYIVHLFVVIGVQAGMDAVALAPIIKFLIVTLVAAILSFGFAHLATKAPVLRRFV